MKWCGSCAEYRRSCDRRVRCCVVVGDRRRTLSRSHQYSNTLVCRSLRRLKMRWRSVCCSQLMRHVAAVPCLVGVLITNSRFPQLYCDSRLSHPHTLSDVSCSVMFFCFVKFHFYLSNGLSLAAHQILEAGHILYMLAFYRCCCPSVGLSVCRSVTLMHVTQLVKIFRCFSMPLGTLAIH